MSRLFLLGFLAGCSAEMPSYLDYPPSMSMVRLGWVEVEDDFVVPEDKYIPGMTLPPFVATDARTDLSAMEDLEDPTLLKEHEALGYSTAPGGLVDAQFEQRLSYDDVVQGQIGDCYFVAALSALLYADASGDLQRSMIRELKNRDGAMTGYAVRFWDYRSSTPFDVVVDAELPRNSSGSPVYATSKDSRPGDEEWGISLVEKAYAQWHAGYERSDTTGYEHIGGGGWPGDVIQAVTGGTTTYRRAKSTSDDAMYAAVEAGFAGTRPMVACTYADDAGVDYGGSGVYANHCYSVHGVSKNDRGEMQIRLRNPWGEVEPPGDGVDDGIFDMPMSRFRELYEGIVFGGGPRRDTTAPSAVSRVEYFDLGNGVGELTFTASGDDGKRGLASGYEIRWSTTALTTSNFSTGTLVPTGSPKAPGETESVEIPNLPLDTEIYFGIRVRDEAGNLSPLVLDWFYLE